MGISDKTNRLGSTSSTRNTEATTHHVTLPSKYIGEMEVPPSLSLRNRVLDFRRRTDNPRTHSLPALN
eukprot:927957-Rhodomonas_salina.2